MEKLSKLLNKYNKSKLYKKSENRALIRKYQENLKHQNLFFKVKNDQDFINFEIIKTSYDNMRAIQNKFFEIRADLDDLWSVLSYQEKHFLLYKDLNPFIDTLKHFYYNDKRYFIAYFDDLINAYYDHEMLMFEKKAYQKYLYNFKDLTISADKYKTLPLQANFSQLNFIAGNPDNYILYSDSVNRFYHFNQQMQTYGISKELDASQIEAIANLILAQDQMNLIDYLITNNLGDKRLLKRLKRLKKRLEKQR